MSFRPFFGSPPRIHFDDDPFTMHSFDHFPPFHYENTMSTPYFPPHPTTNPRPPLFYDPFPMHNWDHFPHFHPENTISTPQFPFHHSNRAPFGGTMTEWHDTPEAHVLRAEVPGFNRDEVRVNVEEGRVLKISGDRKVEKEENHEGWHRAKFSQGKFLRTLPLPENCRPERMTTSFEGGVLTVTVPKADAVDSYVRIPIKD